MPLVLPSIVSCLNAIICFRSSSGLPIRMPILAKAVTGFRQPLRGVQQGFRRNAADVETGTAVARPLFDHRDLEAELGRPNRAHVAAGACPDDRDIEGIGHAQSSSSRRCGSSSDSLTRTRNVTASRPSTMR